MKKLIVAASPHIQDGSSTRRIMLDVIIALIPALIVAVVFFGPRVLLLTATTIAAAMLSEVISRKIMKRNIDSIKDLTAVITGLLLALSLPVSMPLWMAAVGAAVAIVVVKQFFGGVGQNFVNPAIVGRLVLMFSYPIATNASWSEPFEYLGADAITSATPLVQMAEGELTLGYLDLFLGVHSGSMGETSILALLIGGLYLIWRRVISPVIPLTFIGSTILVVALAGGDPLAHLLTGSLVFVAIFMATDYATSPIHLKGRIIFGIGCGVITAIIRLFGALPEGVSFAVIIMNILVPHIENLTIPKVFGYKKEGKS
jgi:electron transport complex protein RnfD